MNQDWHNLYDYPCSHGFYRSVCQLHGAPVPPNVDYDRPSMAEVAAESDRHYKQWADAGFPNPFPYYSKEIEDTVIHQRKPYNHQHTVIDI